MDLVVNHTSDGTRGSWSPARRRTPPSATGTGGGRRARGWPPGSPGAEPTNWHSYFSGPTWELDEASGEYYLHLFDRRQPGPELGEPRGPAGGVRDDAGWLDRGVDGFRMDVINMISKDVAPDGSLPDGPPLPGLPYGDGTASFLCGPRIHEFLQEMHREVFAGGVGREQQLLTVGEMPGRDRGAGAAVHRPGAGRGGHGVPVRARRARTTTAQVAPAAAADARPQGLVRPLAGGWPTSAGTPSTGTTTTSRRAVSRFGTTRPRYRPRTPPTVPATLLHLHRGRVVYQGEELGDGQRPAFGRFDDFRDVESLNHFSRRPVAHGRTPTTGLVALRRIGRDNAAAAGGSGTDSPNAGFTTGTPWHRGQPRPQRSGTPTPSAPTRPRCSPTTGG
jgi:oligo-1,6-glucosidase